MAPIGLDIVCFRYDPSIKELDLNALNKEILVLLHEEGIAIPSYTTLNGQYCIRVAIANHRTTFEDFDYFVKEVIALGQKLQDQYMTV